MVNAPDFVSCLIFLPQGDTGDITCLVIILYCMFQKLACALDPIATESRIKFFQIVDGR